MNSPRKQAREEWQRYFSPEAIQDIEDATKALRKGFPWLEAEPKVRKVAYRATFPRSISGKRQDDHLCRVLSWKKRDDPITEDLVVEITRAASVALIANEVAGRREAESLLEIFPRWELAQIVFGISRLSPEADHPKNTFEFFRAVVEALEYLENFHPTDGDFAIQALQEAFVGLMQSKYSWGKSGLPTKGEVKEMAEAHLERQGKSKKSGWTDLLRVAGLDWLPEGPAGRPPKREVDENRKAKQEVLSKQTQYVNGVLGGKWKSLLPSMNSLLGKHLFKQEEQARLEEANDFPYDDIRLE